MGLTSAALIHQHTRPRPAEREAELFPGWSHDLAAGGDMRRFYLPTEQGHAVHLSAIDSGRVDAVRDLDS